MLGRHLKSALEDSGYKVISVSKPSSIVEDEGSWDLRKWPTDNFFDNLFDGVYAIIHAGALVPSNEKIDKREIFNANVRSCYAIGQWALERNIPMVYISGAIVYADILKQNQTEDSELGWNGFGGAYGLSKLQAEDVFQRLREQGLKCAIIRASSIYGYGMKSDKMIMRFIKLASAGQEIRLKEPLDESVDLIHAFDVSQAAIKIIEQECWDVFNIASGKPASILQVAEDCLRIIKTGSLFVEGKASDGNKPITRFSLSTEKALRKLGWRSAVSVEDGIKMTVNKSTLFPLADQMSK